MNLSLFKVKNSLFVSCMLMMLVTLFSASYAKAQRFPLSETGEVKITFVSGGSTGFQLKYEYQYDNISGPYVTYREITPSPFLWWNVAQSYACPGSGTGIHMEVTGPAWSWFRVDPLAVNTTAQINNTIQMDASLLHVSAEDFATIFIAFEDYADCTMDDAVKYFRNRALTIFYYSLMPLTPPTSCLGATLQFGVVAYRQTLTGDSFNWPFPLDGSTQPNETSNRAYLAFRIDPCLSMFIDILNDVTLCTADINADGTVDGSDYTDFANSFAIGDVSIDAAADVNLDGNIDGTDFIEFMNAFSEGC